MKSRKTTPVISIISILYNNLMKLLTFHFGIDNYNAAATDAWYMDVH